MSEWKSSSRFGYMNGCDWNNDYCLYGVWSTEYLVGSSLVARYAQLVRCRNARCRLGGNAQRSSIDDVMISSVLHFPGALRGEDSGKEGEGRMEKVKEGTGGTKQLDMLIYVLRNTRVLQNNTA